MVIVYCIAVPCLTHIPTMTTFRYSVLNVNGIHLFLLLVSLQIPQSLIHIQYTKICNLFLQPRQLQNITSTFLHNVSDDVSWSNIQCNWDTFSFESELISRSQFAAENLQHLKSQLEEIDISEEYEDINDLINIKSDFNTARTYNQKILSEASDIKDVTGELRKNVTLLTSKCQSLQKHIEDLEKEESLLLTEYKHHKIAYRKALEKYSTHFDMSIDVIDRSESSVEALIKFASSTSSPLIKIVVDKNEGKVMRFDSAGILSKEEEDIMCTKESVREMLCNIREIIYSKDINNSMQNM